MYEPTCLAGTTRVSALALITNLPQRSLVRWIRIRSVDCE